MENQVTTVEQSLRLLELGIPARNASMVWERYAMNGRNISTASLPKELLRAYYYRWSAGEKQQIVRTLRDNLDELKRIYGID